LFVLFSRFPRRRGWCPAPGELLERRGEQPCKPFVHLLGEDWVGLHWQPERRPSASAAQPFARLVGPCPGTRRDVACARPIAPRTPWLRAGESCLPVLNWRRLYQSGPPMARNGPKDLDLTPVVPRYYSPGLPASACCSSCTSVVQRIRVEGINEKSCGSPEYGM
jgi:hypothetical protein